MTPAHIDRVFGRGRLRMVTGDHVEVFREEALPGERRRYTKRFLATPAGDFRHWTEREWRILARLVGHGIGPVPDVVQFDRGAADRPALEQTYDAGVTVDHWATLLPVQRDGAAARHVFEDCAHWWALAHHCLRALDAIHELRLVHLDLKADNVCIPLGPADFDPYTPGRLLTPQFDRIALIDFAFSLVSGESLDSALPIGRQADFDYQSPRLLHALAAGSRGDLTPTRQLDWRCDIFSLAAMLRRYLPDPEGPLGSGWTSGGYAQARALVRRLLEVHDADLPARRPHAELIALTSQALDEPALAASMRHGWTLAAHDEVGCDNSPTPVTRIALPLFTEAPLSGISGADREPATRPAVRTRERMRKRLWVAGLVAGAAIGGTLMGQAWLARDRPPVEHPGAAPPPVQAIAHAPAAPAATPPIDKASIGAGPALTGKATQTPGPEPTPVLPRAKAAKAERGPARPVPAPAPAAATTTVPATPRSPVRVIAPPTNRPTPITPAPLSERERALAWLSMRGPAPRSAPPSRAGSLQAPAPAPAPAPVPASAPALASAPGTPPATTAVTRSPTAPATNFVARGNELMAGPLAPAAQRAERLVQSVLNVADQSDNALRDNEIRSAAYAIRLAPDDPLMEVWVDTNEARLFSEGAAIAYWRRGSIQEALVLQRGAFGANPRDPDIAGNLAFYHLRQQPAQADTARQLALYALTTRDRKYPTGRIEDWTTLAIASALSGRERDARNAWFVTVALAPNLARQCKAAAEAYAQYGERLRAPVEAMLYRVHSSGRSERSVDCDWPTRGTAARVAR